MNFLVRILEIIYRWMLTCYPQDFRNEFSNEMQVVFLQVANQSNKGNLRKLLGTFLRELKDWPGLVLTEHIYSMKEKHMNPNDLRMKTLKKSDFYLTLTIFLMPALPGIVVLIFGPNALSNRIGSILVICLLTFVFLTIGFGFVKGFPIWTIPYLGVVVNGIVMLKISHPLWNEFYIKVQQSIGYSTKTLQVRILYQALRAGFAWLCVFIVIGLLLLLLSTLSHTRKLTQRIRLDWSLFSFMIYSGLVFNLFLIFDEYTHDEIWQILSWATLAAGVWIYLKSKSTRARVLALFSGASLTFWIAAIGKWIILPLQSWGSWYGYDHWAYRRFEFWSTLAQWGWVMFFMAIPALLNMINSTKTTKMTQTNTTV